MKETVIGWLKERAFDWAKDQIASRTSEQEIRSALNAFIERENKVNELCSIAEEIDFEGVCKYVQSDEFRVDIERRLLSGSKKNGVLRGKRLSEKRMLMAARILMRREKEFLVLFLLRRIFFAVSMRKNLERETC